MISKSVRDLAIAKGLVEDPVPQAFVVAEGASVVLPEGLDLADAVLQRTGPDLVVTTHDGSELVIADYFMSETLPQIVDAHGAPLDEALVAPLREDEVPDQPPLDEAPAETVAEVANEFPADAPDEIPDEILDEIPDEAPGAGFAPQEPIGRISASTGEVSVMRAADAARIGLKTADAVFQGDIVETGPEAGVGILLADGTSLSMGADGRVVLDEMLYDFGAPQNRLVLSVLKGVFTIVAGGISRISPDAMVVHTTLATLGVRGAQVGVDLADHESLRVVMMEKTDGFVGESVVSNQGGEVVLDKAHAVVKVSSYDAPPNEMASCPRDLLLQVFGVTFAFLSDDDDNGNDYGLRSVLSEELAAGESVQETSLCTPAVPETPVEPGSVLPVQDGVFVGRLSGGELGEGVLIFRLAEDGAPAHGAVVIHEDGMFAYTPDPDHDGEDSFTYRVGDEAAHVVTAAVAVNVVTPAQEPVLAVAHAAGVEKTAIALVIAAAMPADATQTIEQITISGLPEGASLSAGEDRGDGRWVLGEDDLKGLVLTPPAAYCATMALCVCALSSDAREVCRDLNVSVAPVCGQPYLSVSDVAFVSLGRDDA